MDIFTQLFQISYIVIALVLNFVILFLKDFIKIKLGGNKIKFLTQYLQMILFLFSFVIVYLGSYTNQLPILLDNNIWITGGWIAILSITIYDIGFKEIIRLFKKFVSKKADIDDKDE